MQVYLSTVHRQTKLMARAKDLLDWLSACYALPTIEEQHHKSPVNGTTLDI
jgi:hypothetical protein